MGLFDAIEQLAKDPSAGSIPVPQPIEQEKGTAAARERHHRRNNKPERLSFLQPCPICHGRSFTHITSGGFACQTCQPGRFGDRVEAAGPELQTTNELELSSVQDPPGEQHTFQQRIYFDAAWPWIKQNLPRLLAAGWTRAALLRRSKYRWPYGTWGAAWLPPWAKDEVIVSLGARGEIVFSYPSGERTISQTVHKPDKFDKR